MWIERHADFPILHSHNRKQPLIYLDSASSAQKPQVVIDAVANFYAHDYANIHRGIYELSERATELYENTRNTIKKFLHAHEQVDIVFVSGTTEGINLLAQILSMGHQWGAGDEIILSEMEHHSNIVPWYLLKEKLGIILKIIPVNDDGSLDLKAYTELFSKRTKLVSVTHASNVLGTINPIKSMAEIAHGHGALFMVDGAQAVAHFPVNFTELDCDFYIFSSHKLYGPTGVGVICAKPGLMHTLPPYQGGGDMIETVGFDRITYASPPQRFEAGTPHIAGVVGLNSALHYLQEIGLQHIHEHEQQLLIAAEVQLSQIEGIRLFGTAKPKVGVISFVLDGVHAHDLGTILDHAGIAIRAGHHCAMPLMTRFNVQAMVRASFGLYNRPSEINALVTAIYAAKRLFA